jgi:hypothetical protein
MVPVIDKSAILAGRMYEAIGDEALFLARRQAIGALDVNAIRSWALIVDQLDLLASRT